MNKTALKPHNLVNIGHKNSIYVPHNPEAGGSNPPPATTKTPEIAWFQVFFVMFEHKNRVILISN